MRKRERGEPRREHTAAAAGEEEERRGEGERERQRITRREREREKREKRKRGERERTNVFPLFPLLLVKHHGGVLSTRWCLSGKFWWTANRQ